MMKAASQLIPNPYLRQARERACLSQEALAERLGTTQVTISRWERGLTTPSFYYRRQLCELFDLPAAALGFTPREKEESTTTEANSALAEASVPDDEEQAAHSAEEAQAEAVEGVSMAYALEPAALPPAAPAHGLVGRDEVIEALSRRLCGSDSERAVTHALYGLPGVGKTTLAAALAHDERVLAAFPDGVLWVGLGRAPNVMGLLAGWGAQVGLSAPAMRGLDTVERWVKAIRSAIGTRHLLIIIDDAWSIAELLAFKVGGPHCCHLATTRSMVIALEFAGRNVTAVQELDEEAGLALLARLAPQVVESEREEARAIVHSVGALPLALTLLGGYLNVEAHAGQRRRVRAALDRLHSAEERLRLAAVPAPGEASPSLPSGASLSLQAVIAVSDERLPAPARAALRALAVFPPKPNSFAEGAALAVSATPPATLDALIDAGLLESRGPDRYTLHQTVADYARLDRSDEDMGAYERLARIYVAYLEEHADRYDALDREAANIGAALDAARDHALDALLVRGVNVFAPFLLARGLYDMAERHVQAACMAARVSGDEAGLVHATYYLGRIAQVRGDLQAADGLYAQSLSLARRTGTGTGASVRTDGHAVHGSGLLSRLLAFIGEIALAHGDFRRAAATLDEGLHLARAAGDRRQMGLLLRLLGQLAHCQGDFAREDACYEEGLAQAREAGDVETMSELLQNMGAKAVKLQLYAEAGERYAEGLALARAQGNEQRISALLSNMGNLALIQQQHPLAEQHLSESVGIARHIGHRLRLANALQNLGRLEGERGNDQQAEVCLHESIELARALAHPFLLSESLCAWGDVQMVSGQAAAASATFAEALTIARDAAAREEEALALYGLARVAAARGETAEAVRLGSESLCSLQAEGHEKTSEVAQWLAAVQPSVHAATGSDIRPAESS